MEWTETKRPLRRHKQTHTQNRLIRIRLAKKERQSSDLRISILSRSLASSSEEGRGCICGREPQVSTQPSTQPVDGG